MDAVKRCAECKRPRDNGHESLCPLCLYRRTLGRINCMINQLTEVK